MAPTTEGISTLTRHAVNFERVARALFPRGVARRLSSEQFSHV